MSMITLVKFVVVQLLVLVVSMSPALAEDHRSGFKQEELDQMLAPIALYPDALLSQILMASTYPLEVVQAARWSRDNPDLKGEDAVRAVEPMDWDPSVKSLVAFPRVVAEMDEKLDWTQRLGEAFLAQQSQVMNTVRDLRQKAYAAGNLKSNEYYRVVPQGRTIVIESPYPEVIHVPYYDPLVVYGPWWWPAYPPVYWAPWPGYYAYPGFAGFYWSFGIVIGPRFFFGAFDWHHQHVTVVHIRHPAVHHHLTKSGQVIWKHDPGHRRGVAFRHAALREKFTPSGRADFEARSDFRQRDPAPLTGGGSLLQRPSDVRGAPDRRSDLRRDTAADRQERHAVPNGRFVTEGSNRRGEPRGTERRTVEKSDGGFTASEPRRIQPDRPVADGRGARMEPRVMTERFREGGRPFANRQAPRAQPGQTVPRGTGMREGMTMRPSAEFNQTVPQGTRTRERVAPPPSAGIRDPGLRMERSDVPRMRQGLAPPPSAGTRDPGLRMERSDVPGMRQGLAPPPSAGMRDPGLRMERGNVTGMRQGLAPPPSAGGRDHSPRMERGIFRGNSGGSHGGGRGRPAPSAAGGRS